MLTILSGLILSHPDVGIALLILPNSADDAVAAVDVSNLQDSSILLCDPSLVRQFRIAQRLPNLRWMQSTWAGAIYVCVCVCVCVWCVMSTRAPARVEDSLQDGKAAVDRNGVGL